MWCSTGFCFGAFAFHFIPLSSVFQGHNLDHHLYADDTQIYISLTTPDACRSLNQLRDCLQDVSLWMKNSKLKLNANKTEFIIIGTVTQRAKLDGFSPTHMLNQSVTPAPSFQISELTLTKASISNGTYQKHAVAVSTISVIFIVFADFYHFLLLKPSRQL